MRLARDEIKLNCLIPSILKRQTITTIANQKAYNLASDFDVPVTTIYTNVSGEQYELDQVYPENLLEKLSGGKTTSTGTPNLYMIFGNVSNLIQLELYAIPENASETCEMKYKPILSLLSDPTDESVLMAKYGLTVIKFTTAYFFYIAKKNDSKFTKWYTLGALDFQKISLR